MQPVSLPIRTAVLGGGQVRRFAFSYQQALAQVRSPSTQGMARSTALPCFRTAPSSLHSTGNFLRRYSTGSSPLFNSSAASNAELGTLLAKQSLDWNSFFKLRASRRRYTRAASIVTAFFSTLLGAQILSSRDFESFGAQVMGLDPFVVLGMSTAACGAVGWLVGPFFGTAIWGTIYRRYTPAVAVKEKEFFDRIKHFRVDPSSNSAVNPVPDFYGEVAMAPYRSK